MWFALSDRMPSLLLLKSLSDFKKKLQFISNATV
jgi:hypothetical protein